MDSAIAAIQRLSPLVDDLASDLPTPLDISQTKKQVSGHSIFKASVKHVKTINHMTGNFHLFSSTALMDKNFIPLNFVPC